MKKILLALLLTSVLKGQTDLKYQMFKNDDNLHYLAGINIANAVGSAVFYETKRPFLSCATGFVAGSLVGIAKEAIWDKRMHKGVCDNADAYSTMWGSLTGALTLRIGINIFYEKKQPIIIEP